MVGSLPTRPTGKPKGPGVWVNQPHPIPGCTEEVFTVIQHCSRQNANWLFTDQLTPGLFDMLPVASSYPALLAGLCTIFCVFMPVEWLDRSTTANQLLLVAINGVSQALQGSQPAIVLDVALMTVVLLYLRDVCHTILIASFWSDTIVGPHIS